jgi:hypothetical protein
MNLVSWRITGVNLLSLRKAAPLNPQFADNMLHATQCYVAPGDI